MIKVNNKQLYFEIDFLKFILVIGMFYRHTAFFLYSERNVSEYGISSLNIHSFFLHVLGFQVLIKVISLNSYYQVFFF